MTEFDPAVWPEFTAKADQLWGQSSDHTRDEMEPWGVFTDVATEVHRQDSKWGPQRGQALVGGQYPELLHHTYVECADEWKQRNDRRSAEGVIGWDGILLEEVFEALESDTVDGACTELVQVMAVCAQMILDLRATGLGSAS